MAILKIARMGHPVLRQRAQDVPDPTAPEVKRLVADMIDTMKDAGGTGLAAPQVHVPQRVVVYFVEAERAEREGEEEVAAVPLTVLINPEIEVLDDEVVSDWEGCLSIPGLQGYVPRARRIRYRGLDETGAPIEREATDFHARVVQHEYDHLQGILYSERMADMTRLGFTEELRRHPPDHD